MYDAYITQMFFISAQRAMLMSLTYYTKTPPRAYLIIYALACMRNGCGWTQRVYSHPYAYACDVCCARFAGLVTKPKEPRARRRQTTTPNTRKQNHKTSLSL